MPDVARAWPLDAPPAAADAVPPRSRVAARVLAAAVGAVGLYFRLLDLGRHGFWTDEAWVALSTRVHGVSQFWMSLSITPVAWAGALRLLSLALSAPEFSLRLLPLAFSVLTMWAAFRVGCRFAGHLAGGLLALAVVALDPLSIQYAKSLKHYSAETFFVLLAFDLALDVARRQRGRDVARLCAVLVLGLPFANAQLLVGPPILGCLLADRIAHRDAPGAGRLAAAAAAVGVCELLHFRLLMAPHLVPSLTAYFAQSYVPATGVADAAGFVARALRDEMAPSLGVQGLSLLATCLVAVAVAGRSQRVVVAALLATLAEVIVLSLLHVVPFHQRRILLFLLTALLVHGAAAAVAVARWLWRRPLLRPAVLLGVLLLAMDFVPKHRALGFSPPVEDPGPLMRFLEAARGPRDAVLVYGKSTYVYAYYQSRPPVLVPALTTVGFAPVFADRNVRVMSEVDVAAAVKDFADREQIWFVGSRLHAAAEEAVRRALGVHGRIVLEIRRDNALLLLVREERP